MIFTACQLGACQWQPFKNLRVGDKSPAPGSIQIDLSKYSCMSEMGKRVDDYLSGRMSERDVHLFGGCLRTALHRFVDTVDGRSKGLYTPDELAIFLNKWYLHEQQLTPPFVREIMKVKVLALGGSIEQITDQEMNGLVDLITFIEAESIANLPYLDFYTQSPHLERAKISRFELSNMRNQLRQTGQHIADRFRIQGQSYDMPSLERLLTEMHKFLRWEQIRPDNKTPEQIVNLFAAHKAIVTGQDSLTILPQDWVMLMDSAASLFGIWVDFQLQLKDLPLTYGAGLDSFVASINEAMALLGRVIDQNPSKLISFSATDKLFDALNDIQGLPSGVRVDSIKETYKFLIQKAFRNPVSTTRNEQVSGLSWQELNEIHAEFYLWAEGQQYLSDNARRSLGLKFGAGDSLLDPIAKALESFDFRQFIDRGVDQKDARSREIERIVHSVPAFFRVGDERAFIMPPQELGDAGVYDGIFDLTRLNIMRGLVRLLIRSAASDDRIVMMNKDWQHTGVTEDEMDEFFNKIRNLGIDLKLFDPRRAGVGRRSFVEGKLFTFAGNGINEPDAQNSHLLNFVQALDLLSTIWSGGKVRDMFYSDIGNLCRQEGFKDGPSDVFGVPMLDRKCFTSHFFNLKLAELDNLPHLRDDFLARKASEKKQITDALEVIGKSPTPDAKYIELGEIATMVTVLHYLEAIFTIYDGNHDNVLTDVEVMHSFKRFSGYLARQARATEHKDVSISLLKSIFAYLVEHQNLPTSTDALTLYWNKYRYFDNDLNQYEPGESGQVSTAKTPTLRVDRVGLLNVLKVLAMVNAQTAATNAAVVRREPRPEEN